MARRNRIASIANLLVLAVVVALNPVISCKPLPSGITDKVEILVSQRPVVDSALVQAQLHELQYYLRTHNVTDEGYNLIAQYHTSLEAKAKNARFSSSSSISSSSTRRYVVAKDRLLPAVKIAGGHWKAGHFHRTSLNGPGITRDALGRIVCAVWQHDSILSAMRSDSLGTYSGQMNADLLACGQGTYDGTDGSHYEGFWIDDQRHGFGFESSPHHPVRVGEWKEDRFLGEKLKYTSERIYGIDISRHQHEKGRRRYAINWSKLCITSLGSRHATGGQTFPVSFVYIKSTEGTSIRNRYFASDYVKARRQGLRVGAYHFFSLKSSALAQATYFVNSTLFRAGDFPPVLDVEPTNAQIQQIGGDEELMRRIRIFMDYVERRTHRRPILYVSQMFVNKHMTHAADIKQRYNVWIARYGEYKPDVKLVYWQLAADGRVSGITGPVDINVFNGYQSQWDEFVRTGFHK